MNIIDEYFTLRAKVFEHFGYEEQWKAAPLSDSRDYYWRITDNVLQFANLERDLGTGQQYESLICSKPYRTNDYTLVYVDTQTDGNQFLEILSNSKERQ